MSDAEHAITPSAIRVREVTNYQFTWTEEDPGAGGTFTLQLILDSGAEEYILRLTADDADVLDDLLRRAENVYFDLDRKVLMFGNSSVS